MIFKKNDILNLNKIERINLINSITGIKPVNLIGTKNSNMISNLAIFSSVVHISSSPPLIGFFLRSNSFIRRDTYENIISEKKYTLNHVNIENIKNAHFTSIKFDKDISEFNACGFTEAYHNDFPAPFVAESEIKIALILREVVKLKHSASKLIVGEVDSIILNKKLLNSDLSLDLENSNSVSVCGLNNYFNNNKILHLPYARMEKLKTELKK